MGEKWTKLVFFVKMETMKDRRGSILRAIVQQFITTASPVGSSVLREEFSFPFSSATIRNEMVALEDEGFLASPHTSAGRVPTERGFRFFVANCREDIFKIRPSVALEFQQSLERHFAEKRADESTFDAVSVLTRLTPNVAFASVPSSRRTFFLGFSNFLKQPEFSSHSDLASGVFRVLEENFETVLENLDIGEDPKIFLGSENVLPEIQSCALIVVRTQGGFLGILGPMRMNYARNIAALEAAKNFLEHA